MAAFVTGISAPTSVLVSNFSNSDCTQRGSAIILVTDDMMYELYINYCWWYARHQQNNFKLDGEDVEDMVQECCIKLILCPQDKRAYIPFVKTVVNNCCRDWLLKHVKPRVRYVSLDAMIDNASYGGDTTSARSRSARDEDGDYDSLINRVLEDPTPTQEFNLMAQDFMDKFWQQADGVEQLLVVLVLGLDGHGRRTYDTAGKMIGLTKEKAKIIYENALDRIRESLK